MSIADKLTTIANNVPLVYEAGKAAGGGGTPVEEKDVNFYDYDGELLYSYTLEEAQALTELPPIPDYHEHLIPYQWNWSLDDVTTLDTNADIGALYDTEDGATYIGLDVSDIAFAEIVLNFGSGTPTIDWGDGTVVDLATTGITHTYNTIGRYEIKITGAHRLGGGTDSTPFVSGRGKNDVIYIYASKDTNAAAYALYSLSFLETASVPRGSNRFLFRGCQHLVFFVSDIAEIFYGQFYECRALRLVTVPKDLGFVHGESFRSCRCLKRLSATDYRLADGSYHFYGCQLMNPVDIRRSAPIMVAYGCYGAKKITVHEGVTSIASQAFYNCFNACVFVIGSTVASIAAQAFQSCVASRRMVFLPTTPPTVANANAFTSLPADCIVEVPAASLTAYQEATNYSGIAAQMVGV